MKHLEHQAKALLLIISALFLLPGCLSWQQGWKQADRPVVEGDTTVLLEKAAMQRNQADSREKLFELINTYEMVLGVDPENKEALTNLGSYYMLMAYGYTDDKAEKKTYYMKSIACCERAFYTNAAFKARVDKGESVWAASPALSKEELGGLYFWYLSVGNTWKECLGGAGKFFNFSWPMRVKKILPVMMDLDPNWYGGTPYFSYATFYAVAPGFAGGDMEKAAEYFDKAYKIGANKLNYRTAKARYYYSKMGDREGFKKDLEWILKQDPHQAGDAYPWAVYHQNDALKLLKNIDTYF